MIYSFLTESGLPQGEVNSLLADEFDQLWLGTDDGVYRVDRKLLAANFSGHARSVAALRFDKGDGMASPEVNDGLTQPSAWKAGDGRLWFATTRGVSVIDSRAVAAAQSVWQNPPSPVIEQVIADGRVVLGDGLAAPADETILSIAPGQGHSLEFKFTLPAYTDGGRITFRYRLIGQADAWHEVGDDRSAHFANLAPGQYRFELSGANHHHLWNATPARLELVIERELWQHWWFYVLLGSIFAGLIWAMLGYRLQWQQRTLKLEEQKTVANERTRIARDLHDDLGTALTGLALELDVIRRDFQESVWLAERLGRTTGRARELAERMRELVWAVNPHCDTVSSLASFLEQQVQQFLRMADVRMHLDFPEEIPPLPVGVEARHQLALSVREALTNVVRHARATEVRLRLRIEARQLTVAVQDNGCGCDHEPHSGQGLKNMKARMHQVGGEFIFESQPAVGTTVTFRLPLNELPKTV
jgi:signal transduction histidine kinase